MSIEEKNEARFLNGQLHLYISRSANRIFLFLLLFLTSVSYVMYVSNLASLGRVVLFFIFGAVATSIFFLSKSIYDDYYSPIGLMGASWFGTVALSLLKLSPKYQASWDAATWSAIIFSFISFFLGVLVIDKKFGVIRQQRTNEVEESEEFIRKIILALFILGGSAFVVQMINTAMTAGLSIFINDPSRARDVFWIFGIGYLYILNFLNFIFCSIYISVYGVRKSILFILVASLLMMPFHLVRTVIILSLIAAYFGIHYATEKRHGIKPMLILSAGIVGFFIMYSIYTGGKEFSTQFIDSGDVNFPGNVWFLVRPYLYLSTNFDNLYAALNQTELEYTLGARTFNPILKLTLVHDSYSLSDVFNAQRAVYGGALNQNTYLGDLYYDFGWPGILIGPALLGALSQFVYKWSRWSQSIAIIAIYSVVAFSVAFSFFANYFSKLYVWEFTILSLFVYVAIKWRAHG